MPKTPLKTKLEQLEDHIGTAIVILSTMDLPIEIPRDHLFKKTDTEQVMNLAAAFMKEVANAMRRGRA